jgi:hypothetical protein
MKMDSSYCRFGIFCLALLPINLALTSLNASGAIIIAQDFDSPGSDYQVLQSGDSRVGGATLNTPQILGGGPSANYLQLAARASGNGVDAQNAIVFSNSSLFAPQQSELKLQYHMQGLANGFGFILLNTDHYGVSGGTVSSLELDRVQVEQAHNRDPLGSRQLEFYSNSLHLALNTFETDRVQLFYDGYKLFDQPVSFSDGWYDLTMTTDFTGPEAIVQVTSNRLSNGSTVFDFQTTFGTVDAFNARPLLAARIGAVGFGDFSIDSISYSVAVPEPSSGIAFGGLMTLCCIWRRVKNRARRTH